MTSSDLTTRPSGRTRTARTEEAAITWQIPSAHRARLHRITARAMPLSPP